MAEKKKKELQDLMTEKKTSVFYINYWEDFRVVDSILLLRIFVFEILFIKSSRAMEDAKRTET